MHSFLRARLTLAHTKQLCTHYSMEPQNSCGWKGSLEAIWSHVLAETRSHTAVPYCYILSIFHSSHRTQCNFMGLDVTTCLLQL